MSGKPEKAADPTASDGKEFGHVMAHEGYIFIDLAEGGRQILTHTLMLKRYPLPEESGPWDIVYEDGYGMLVSQSSDTVLFLEEWLPDQLIRTPTGGRIVRTLATVGGGSEAHEYSLEERMRDHECRHCRLELEHEEVTLQVFTIRRPRGAARLMWSIFGIYRILNLSCYAGQPSKWSYNSFAAWEKFLARFGFNGCLVKSWQGLPTAQALEETERILPTPGVGSSALLLLAFRWAGGNARNGGLRQDGAVMRAKSLVKTLCRAAHIKPFKIVLDLWFDWEFTWPRPQPLEQHSITLEVSQTGTVDMTEWRGLVQDAREFGVLVPAPARKWYEMLEVGVYDTGALNLHDFFLLPGLADDEGCYGMVGQIARAVGERVEVAYYQSMQLGNCTWPIRADSEGDFDDWSLREVDRVCMTHVLAAQRASANFNVLGMAVDKFSARSLELANGCVVLPNNVGYDAVPQVVTYASTASDLIPAKRKGMVEDLVERRTTYLKYIDGQSQSFRAKQQHRSSVVKVLALIDNQVRVCTKMEGLSSFCGAKRDEDWKSWRDWRHLSLASDQGSDMLSSLHSLEYCEKVKCVVTTYWDPEHGSNRNVWGAIDGAGLKPLMMLVMMIHNLPTMPDDTDLRLRQLRDLMCEHYEVLSPGTSPIFQYYSNELHKERAADIQREDNETKDAALWKLLYTDSYYRRKGDRCCIARFNAIVGLSRKLLQTWTSLTFELTVCALEAGMIEKRVLPKLALKTGGADSASVGETGATSRKVVTAIDRTLRSCGANGVVVALATMQTETNKRHLAAVVHGGLPVMSWSGAAAKQAKSVEENIQWFTALLTGGLCAVVDKIFGNLVQAKYLEDASFVPPLRGNLAIEEVGFEDEVAGVSGLYHLVLVQQHLRRFLWMYGYPHKLIVALEGEDQCNQALRELEERAAKINPPPLRASYTETLQIQYLGSDTSALKKYAFDIVVSASLKDDLACFRQMEALGDNKPTIVTRYFERSHSQKLSVTQVILACQELGFQQHEELIDLLRERFSTVMTTAIVEHLNNWQKNSAQVSNWGGKYRRPQNCLTASIRGEVVSKLHRYQALDKNIPSYADAKPLVKEDLSPLGKPSMDFSPVRGTSQKAPYHSPAARHVGIPVADAEVLRAAGGEFDKLEHTWANFFVDASHLLVFRRAEDQDGMWWLGLDNFPNSGVLVWPVTVKQVPTADGPIDMVEFGSVPKPCVMAIFGLDDITSFCFQFRSWTWQVQSITNCESRLAPGLRGFRCTPVGSVLETCARRAWFQLQRSDLAQIAESLKLETRRSTTSFDLLYGLTEKVLGTEPAATMDILSGRFHHLITANSHSAEILQVDEAAKSLDETDRDTLHKCQAAVDSNLRTFRKAFSEKQRSLEKRPAGLNKKVLNTYKGPRKFVLNGEHTDQKAVKAYFPPGAYVWRVRRTDSWCARFRDLPTRTCKDTAWGGEVGAIRECARYCWSWYLCVSGLDDSLCPVEGLFDGSASGSSQAAA